MNVVYRSGENISVSFRHQYLLSRIHWSLNFCHYEASPTHHISTSHSFNCNGKVSGFYADPTSCTHYFICVGSNSFGVDCASGLHFNDATKFCDWPNNAHCHLQQSVVTTAKPTHAPVATTHRPQTTRPFYYFTTRPTSATTPPKTIPNLGTFYFIFQIRRMQTPFENGRKKSLKWELRLILWYICSKRYLSARVSRAG